MANKFLRRPRPVLRSLSVDNKNVTVGFSLLVGQVEDVYRLNVPLTMLLHDDVISALDEAARRRLNEKWSGRFTDEPLFDLRG